jgi:hypothetical protein
MRFGSRSLADGEPFEPVWSCLNPRCARIDTVRGGVPPATLLDRSQMLLERARAVRDHADESAARLRDVLRRQSVRPDTFPS